MVSTQSIEMMIFVPSLGRASRQVSWRVGAIHLRAKHPAASLERVSDKESLGFELQLTDHPRNQNVSCIKMTHYLGNWEGIERDGASGLETGKQKPKMSMLRGC